MTAEQGIVVRRIGGVWGVWTDGCVERVASLRGRLKQSSIGQLKLAVGDRVMITPDPRGGTHWSVVEILPRGSSLVRRAPGGRREAERVVIANIDQVIVVIAAANPTLNPRAIDRFLVIAAANDLAARIVVNKADLADESDVRERFAVYERAGYRVDLTSVRTGVGIEELHSTLKGQTSALSGPSGVGKSSLLNAMYPGLSLRVGALRAEKTAGRGRHTTVGAFLHPLPDGGFVADTPGLREIGIWGIEARELDRCFPEFRPALGECRFGDCTHRTEPGCAVRALVDSGSISRDRYQSYVKLFAELEEYV